MTPSIAGLQGDPQIQAILANAQEDEKITDDEFLNATFMETYTSPCEKLVNALRERNASEDQITAVLEKNGYWWVPGAGHPACGTGTHPSKEEQEELNKIRGPDYHPFPEKYYPNGTGGDGKSR